MTVPELAAAIQEAAADSAKRLRAQTSWNYNPIQCEAMERAAEALEGFAENLAAALIPDDVAEAGR